MRDPDCSYCGSARILDGRYCGYSDPFLNGTSGLFPSGARWLGRQGLHNDQTADDDAKSRQNILELLYPAIHALPGSGSCFVTSHIDELPQLWNVWRGDMSLVGPRPEQPHLANLYRDIIPNYPLRHVVRPGLSGYAQVHFGYAANLAETRLKLEYDLYYIRHIGPGLDLMIICRTLAILLKNGGER